MEGDPADLTVYIDTNPSHDLSYYGNGCNVGWGTDGSAISHTPCSTRLVTTVDDETQKNGTLYHFQAATAGAGGSISTGNTNSPDTFCPLGWQLPYSGTGGDYYDKSKSWRYLFTIYNYNDDTQGRIGAMSYPLSYIQAGSFDGVRGGIYGQDNGAYYISETNRSSIDYYRTWINLTNALQFSQIITKAFQSAVRCVLFLASEKAFRNADAKISSICVICGPDATTWSASARSPVTTGATKRSAKTPNVEFLPLQNTAKAQTSSS